VRLSGRDSLADVARRVFRDARLASLLAELNPKAQATGALPSGTVITLPSMEEARAFASKMGFSLGFDPTKTGGTRAKRAWARLQTGNRREGPVDADPRELVVVLGGQDKTPEEVAKRILALCSEAAVDAFVAESHDDEARQLVAAACDALRLRVDVRRFISALSEAIVASTTAAGRRALMDALALDGAAADEVLEGLLVVQKLRVDLGRRAEVLAPLLERAEALAKEDEHVRAAKLAALDKDERSSLEPLVGARVDGVALLDGPRLESLGVQKMFAALDKHLGQLSKTLDRLLPLVDRASRELCRGVLGHGATELPRPWPVVAKLHQGLAERVAVSHAGRRGEKGIAAFARVRGREADGPKMNAGELAAAAAHNAQVAREQDEIGEQLGPRLAELFDAYRPSSRDKGDQNQVIARRRKRFSEATLTARDHDADAAVVAEIVEAVFKAAKAKVPAGTRAGAASVAAELGGQLTVMLRGGTEVCRALLVATVALDPELGPTLSRPTGREAAVELIRKHATRVVSLAAHRYAEPAS
jgi:hypothetical protein